MIDFSPDRDEVTALRTESGMGLQECQRRILGRNIRAALYGDRRADPAVLQAVLLEVVDRLFPD